VVYWHVRGILHTDRLLLKPAQAADTQRLIAVNDPAHAARVTKFVETQLSWWQDFYYGLWLIAVPDDEVIGWCGLRPGDTLNDPEILYGLSATHRKQGYATEAARAVIDYAFSLSNIESVWAATDVNNTPSYKVMERAGMTFEAQRDLDGVMSLIYRIKRDGISDGQHSRP
jgi:[ribosomal protein S5]-alanine N-acetyltransferase